MTLDDLRNYADELPDCNSPVRWAVQELDALRAENAKLREAAGKVIESKYEIHSLEFGEGYIVHGEAIDALREALAEPRPGDRLKEDA